MTRVFFHLYLRNGNRTYGPPIAIINGIQELIFPGRMNLSKSLLDIAKRYDGSEAWFVISALGRNHSYPFHYNNGVVETWSEYSSNQLMYILASGGQSMLPNTLPLCG